MGNLLRLAVLKYSGIHSGHARDGHCLGKKLSSKQAFNPPTLRAAARHMESLDSDALLFFWHHQVCTQALARENPCQC